MAQRFRGNPKDGGEDVTAAAGPAAVSVRMARAERSANRQGGLPGVCVTPTRSSWAGSGYPYPGPWRVPTDPDRGSPRGGLAIRDHFDLATLLTATLS